MQLAQKANKRIHIPSGAIAGLDGIKAAALSNIQEIKIVNRKPPSALRGAPGADNARVNLDSLTKPYTLFSGTVAQGYRLFPANVNVAVAVSLAGIGVDKTKMEVVADPDISILKGKHQKTTLGPVLLRPFQFYRICNRWYPP